jgi:hypothetical protein
MYNTDSNDYKKMGVFIKNTLLWNKEEEEEERVFSFFVFSIRYTHRYKNREKNVDVLYIKLSN